MSVEKLPYLRGYRHPCQCSRSGWFFVLESNQRFTVRRSVVSPTVQTGFGASVLPVYQYSEEAKLSQAKTQLFIRDSDLLSRGVSAFAASASLRLARASLKSTRPPTHIRTFKSICQVIRVCKLLLNCTGVRRGGATMHYHSVWLRGRAKRAQ